MGRCRPSRRCVGQLSAREKGMKLFAELTAVSSRRNWNVVGGREIFAGEAEWFCQLCACKAPSLRSETASAWTANEAV